MTELEIALETAVRLRASIATEIESARGERHLLRTLDSSGLFTRATHRSAFLAEAGRLERMLAASLRDAAAAAGVREITLEALRANASAPGAALADVLSEVRALAGALQEIDRLNLELARRALAVVNGYVETLHPSPGAYDRFGARQGTPALALVQSKG